MMHSSWMTHWDDSPIKWHHSDDIKSRKITSGPHPSKTLDCWGYLNKAVLQTAMRNKPWTCTVYFIVCIMRELCWVQKRALYKRRSYYYAMFSLTIQCFIGETSPLCLLFTEALCVFVNSSCTLCSWLASLGLFHGSEILRHRIQNKLYVTEYKINSTSQNTK